MSRPSLLLLCGLLCDRTVWEHQAKALAAQAEVHVHDFRGLDRIEAMAATVLADAPPRFALAGHSMGARVALEVFRQAPARVDRIALLDTGIHTVRPGEREQRMRLVELARREGMAALAAAWLPPMLADDAAHELRAALAAMVERMTPEDFEGQVEALLARPDPAALLAALPRPVLVGVGELDRWSPPAQHAELAGRIGAGAPVVFAGAGHMAPCEAPDAVSAALRDWLSAPA
jgi:pimeloyl-ACP methyl ester carboxylesterase